MTPVDGDDEEQTADGERGAGDYLPGSGHFEQRDFRGGEPGSGDEYKQEADFGDDHAGVVIQRPENVTRRSRHGK